MTERKLSRRKRGVQILDRFGGDGLGNGIEGCEVSGHVSISTVSTRSFSLNSPAEEKFLQRKMLSPISVSGSSLRHSGLAVGVS